MLKGAHRTGAAAGSAVVAVTGIAKSFGGVRALAGVQLHVDAGETLGVVGHNGAGKTTLMNVLVGLIRPDAGRIFVGGDDVTHPYSVGRAAALGIRCVYQELALCPNLSVAENTRVLHHSIRGPHWKRDAGRLIRGCLDDVFPGHGISPAAVVDGLSIGQRQMVEIARAVSVTDTPARLLILDEPTSSLDAVAAEQLFRFLTVAKGRGLSTVFISHRLNEVLAHTDRTVIMRDGEVVGSGPSRQLSRDAIIESMGNVTREKSLPGRAAEDRERAPLRVEVTHYSSPALHRVSMRARAGEVVGLAGLDGHGQQDLLVGIFAGASGGTPAIRVNGRVAYVSGDRQREGVFPAWPIAENVTVASLRALSRFGLVDVKTEARTATGWVERLNIRTPTARSPILSLSGGSQQKVLVARALASNADIVLFDDPLRGVDVGTKQELYERMRREAAAGRCFIWRTTQNEELVHCDRVYVLHHGYVVDVAERAEFSEERILQASFARADHAGNG